MKSNFRSIRRGDEAKTSIADQFPTTPEPAARDDLQPLEPISDTSYVFLEVDSAENFTGILGIRQEFRVVKGQSSRSSRQGFRSKRVSLDTVFSSEMHPARLVRKHV